MTKCDPITGACMLPDQKEMTNTHPLTKREGLAIHYIGDPMCSWCWGISPTISAIEAFCKKEGIEFSITMGGLRAGGGDPWNTVFKDFLHKEWQHIGKTTGQPFGFTLLKASYFNYDTEPACRAVAAVKLLQVRGDLPSSIVLAFFSAVQHKFYVEGQDPKEVNFYSSICDNLSLDFDLFSSVFNSPEALDAVQQEFNRCRQWGVRSFPTLLFESHGKIKQLAAGYITEEQALSRLRQEINIK